MFKVRVGDDGVSVFGDLWYQADALAMHGVTLWVGNSLLCCAEVDPSLLHDENPPEYTPLVIFH